jgi:hypothetical protein
MNIGCLTVVVRSGTCWRVEDADDRIVAGRRCAIEIDFEADHGLVELPVVAGLHAADHTGRGYRSGRHGVERLRFAGEKTRTRARGPDFIARPLPADIDPEIGTGPRKRQKHRAGRTRSPDRKIRRRCGPHPKREQGRACVKQPPHDNTLFENCPHHPSA